MVAHILIALRLVGPPGPPAPVCTLAGPPVEARWSGTIPAASRADPPLRVVADVPLPGSASRFDYQSLEAGFRPAVHLAHGRRNSSWSLMCAPGESSGIWTGFPP